LKKRIDNCEVCNENKISCLNICAEYLAENNKQQEIAYRDYHRIGGVKGERKKINPKDRMIIELWLRIRDRLKDEILTRETDLKILEKWREDYESLKSKQ